MNTLSLPLQKFFSNTYVKPELDIEESQNDLYHQKEQELPQEHLPLKEPEFWPKIQKKKCSLTELLSAEKLTEPEAAEMDLTAPAP